MSIVIHHNPECGTSRQVLALIEESGRRPHVIFYLQEGWTRPYLRALFAAADLTPRQALRHTHDLAQDMGLLSDDIDDDTILQAMINHPILVNRPFVCSPKGVRLCRPAPMALALL